MSLIQDDTMSNDCIFENENNFYTVGIDPLLTQQADMCTIYFWVFGEFLFLYIPCLDGHHPLVHVRMANLCSSLVRREHLKRKR